MACRQFAVNAGPAEGNAGPAAVFKLPPERGQVNASIAFAHAGAAKLLADLQKEILTGLRPVPARMALAAEAWGQCEENSANARKWLNVVDIYVALLKDSRERIVSAAAAGIDPALGRKAAEAIASVEDAAARVQAHAKSGPSSSEASGEVAMALGSAARLLEEALAAIFQPARPASKPR